MGKYFITKNYQAKYSAGGKAKIDCERVLEKNGFQNLGLPRTVISNAIISFFLTAISSIIGVLRLPKGSTICIQYPLKKYYKYIVRNALKKDCQVITVVHDLGSHRRKKKEANEEIELLNQSHCLVIHNEEMKKWLLENGCTTQIQTLSIFDYLRETPIPSTHQEYQKTHEIVYAGGLSIKKNKFIYDLDSLEAGDFSFKLYGVGFNPSMIDQDKSIINYQGFFPADQVMDIIKGSFGLVWDGDSLDCCSGTFGEYLRLNNPHKFSLYMQCGLPVIIWDQAAMAAFVKEHGVGLCISSLHELNSLLENLSKEAYDEMVQNVIKVRQQLSDGFYLKTAIENFIG